jgi:DNA polymerase IV
VPPRFTAYAEASAKVFEIFESVTPLVEGLSLDEAFLDVSASTALFGTPAAIASRLRARIRDEVGLPASAGLAPVKFVAKIASDLAKPNGQREVAEGEVVAFLRPLPVAKLWGVGPKTEETLHALGLRTLGDVAAREEAWLLDKLGSSGPQLRRLSLGLDDREVVPDRQQKSLGAEDTFEENVANPAELHAHLHGQALRVGQRLRKAGLSGRVVVLKLKLADFSLVTRRRTLPEPTDDGQSLYREALALLAENPPQGSVRLTGVSAQDLAPRGQGQLGLFAGKPKRESKLNAALDRISEKFGAGAITTADLAGRADGEDDEARRLVGAARYDGAKAAASKSAGQSPSTARAPDQNNGRGK